MVATARKIAERVYRLLKYGAEYVRQGIEAYEAAYQNRVVKGLARKAAQLGYQLLPAPERLREAAVTPGGLPPCYPNSKTPKARKDRTTCGGGGNGLRYDPDKDISCPSN